MLDQPTRGLDVGSIEFIHRQAIAKRDAGTAVLLVSAELDEVLEMSDRIAVMYRGRIVAIVDGRTADKNEVGLLMATGGRRRRAGRGDDRRRCRAHDARPRRRPRPAPRSLAARLWSDRPACRSSRSCWRCSSVPSSSWRRSSLLPDHQFDLAPAGHGLRRADQGLASAASSAIVNTLVVTAPLVLARAVGRARLQGRPVQHRRAGPVPMGALGAVIVGVAVADQPPVIAIPSLLAAGIIAGACLGLHPGLPQGGLGRPRGRDDDHAQLHRDRRSWRGPSADRSGCPARHRRSPTTSATRRCRS